MSGRYRDRVVVLRAWPLGERDRLVALLSEHHGKLRAVARGVLGPRSRLRGLLQPSVVLDAELWRGRSLDGIAQAQLVAGNLAVQESLEPHVVGWIYELLDLVEGLATENVADGGLFTLLTRGLGLVLEAPDPALFGALVLRAVQLGGVAPPLDRCERCGASSGLARVDPLTLQARCDRCGGTWVGEDVVAASRLVLAGRTREGMAAVRGEASRRFEAFAVKLGEAAVGRALRGGVLSRG